MPPKIKELISELQRNGFRDRGGRGSHRNYYHPLCTKIDTISGRLGNDAERYQIRQVKEAIGEVKGK